MEKVLIEVIGTQNIDSQFDKTELKTAGTFEELEEKYIIRYKEEQGEGEAPVDVSVVVLKDESVVEMTRNGAISSRLVIERSQRNLCHYGTAYGDIPVAVYTREVLVEESEKGGEMRLDYDVFVGGERTAATVMTLTWRL